ncbi:MAG: rod shape-determining protein MreD [Parcubacteria group bacterium]
MRIALITIAVILVAWIQIMYPAALAPWHLVPATALLMIFALALYYEPHDQVVWFALLGGIAVDLWQPSHFGTWSLACLVVALVTRVVRTRLLLRSHWLSILTVALLAIAAGEAIVVSRELLGLSISSIGQTLARFYLPRIALDMLLVVPFVTLVRSVLKTLRAAGEAKLSTHAGRQSY